MDNLLINNKFGKDRQDSRYGLIEANIRNFTEVLRKIRKRISQNTGSPGRHFNPRSSECEEGMLTARKGGFVIVYK